jgi:hypothetical protein
MKQNEFNKILDKIIKDMTKKYGLTKHRLLNYGGMIGSEFQARIKALKDNEEFDRFFDDYINERK